VDIVFDHGLLTATCRAESSQVFRLGPLPASCGLD